MDKKIKIAGTGCALADFLYNDIDFTSPEFKKYHTKKEGDGGLSPGKLVFTEELEKFASKKYPQIISDIAKGRQADTFNIGGPSLVSLIHAAQMLPGEKFEVNYYGISGKDETAAKIEELLRKTPVGFSNYLPKSKKTTPFTHVLSDPNFENGNGERTFINNIGAAWDLTPNKLPGDFFSAEIVCFGGTALTPNIHDNLHVLLKKVKLYSGITIVNTVYDFRNEKQNPKIPWPLGDTEKSFPNIDILIMDNEEAMRISGGSNISEMLEFFRKNTSAFIITRGPDTTLFFSKGTLFEKESGELPVSSEVLKNIQTKKYKGDTTGCGDNFVGGVIASIAGQLRQKKKILNLKEVVVSGICSGGFACSYTGGTFFEKKAGEKKNKVDLLVKGYKNQLYE